MFYAIVDCDNCYVSCERVFHPELKNKPVVVLSNNDGCVVARSKEAKQLGVKAGTPFFQLERLFPKQEIAVFSSNYELYGDMTARVMSIIRRHTDYFFRYSIDEAFCHLNEMRFSELKAWGERLHKEVERGTGIPVSIGIARTKTLAKAATWFAKHYAGYRHCCVIDTEEKREKALRVLPIDEVWGIGRRYAKKLQAMNLKTAADLTSYSEGWVQSMFNINMQRTWNELRGIDSVPDEKMTAKKSICVSRSLAEMTNDLNALRPHIANYAARCAEKLRRQQTAASVVSVFLYTNPFREDLQQTFDTREITLLTPTSDTARIVSAAKECLRKAFKHGYYYKKVGVVVTGIVAQNSLQTNFVDYDAAHFSKIKRLNQVVDKMNKLYGRETVTLAAQQYPKKQSFADAIRHEYRSKNPTTRWSDIIILK